MTKLKQTFFSTGGILMGAVALAMVPILGHAQDRSRNIVGTIEAADPTVQGDRAMGAAAAARKNFGTRWLPADMELKAAADRAHAEAVRSGVLRPSNRTEPDAAGAAASRAPAVVCPPPGLSCLNFEGLAGDTPDTGGTPPDNEGAIGPTRYIQTINSAVAIFNRTTEALIDSGSLNQLAGVAGSVITFDPQIIWDPTTNRFYYTMDAIFSATNNKLPFGFSKTASPGNVTTDWCHYQFNYGTPFPDYPKLGDSTHFIIIGVNVFANNDTGGYVGSDIVAIGKPANGAITTCPAASTLKKDKKANLKDTSNNQVFTPVPSNQIDNNPTGFVVTRPLGLPATKLWFFNVTKDGTGAPVFGNARGVTVTSYTLPPNATQPTFGQVLDTLDARNTQAVQAINPGRAGPIHSFWTQHTIKSGNFSAVRWYEIDPAPATPVVLQTGNIARANSFQFNAAISPDRKKSNAAVAFGDSFVIQYNESSSLSSIAPRIVARSSASGGALSGPVVIKPGVGPYRDFSCPSSGDVCRWGDYAAATPDPRPTTTATGMVWGTNQFSGVLSPPVGDANWRTEIFALQP